MNQVYDRVHWIDFNCVLRKFKKSRLVIPDKFWLNMHYCYENDRLYRPLVKIPGVDKLRTLVVTARYDNRVHNTEG